MDRDIARTAGIKELLIRPADIRDLRDTIRGALENRGIEMTYVNRREDQPGRVVNFHH